MRVGQRSYIPGAGYIRVDAVDQVELAELTDEDAWLDGFNSAAELLGEINELYADQIRDGHQAYRVRFHVLPPEEQVKLSDAKKD